MINYAHELSPRLHCLTLCGVEDGGLAWYGEGKDFDLVQAIIYNYEQDNYWMDKDDNHK